MFLDGISGPSYWMCKTSLKLDYFTLRNKKCKNKIYGIGLYRNWSLFTWLGDRVLIFYFVVSLFFQLQFGAPKFMKSWVGGIKCFEIDETD